MGITLVIYQESLHDARSTKCKIHYTLHFRMLFHSYPYEKYKTSCVDFYENPACPAAFRVKYIHKILPKLYNKCEVKLDNLLHCCEVWPPIHQFSRKLKMPATLCGDFIYRISTKSVKKCESRWRNLFTPRNKVYV